MSAENAALIRRAIDEAVNKGNLSVLDEIVAPSYRYHEPTAGELKGPDGLKQLVSMYRGAFPDIRVTIDDQVDAGNTIVSRWTGTGTHRGELLGAAPTGNKIRITGIIITRVEGGKIVEEWENYDALGMLQQLGLVQLPARAAGR